MGGKNPIIIETLLQNDGSILFDGSSQSHRELQSSASWEPTFPRTSCPCFQSKRYRTHITASAAPHLLSETARTAQMERLEKG